MPDAPELTEELLQGLLDKAKPFLSKEIRLEIAHQMAPVLARLSAIETTAAMNGQIASAARLEVAGLVGMLTGWFGTDGMGGTYGILIRDSAASSSRANALAHDIRVSLDSITNMLAIRDGVAGELGVVREKEAVTFEKLEEKRSDWWKWAVGVVVGAAPAAWGWLHKHWAK